MVRAQRIYNALHANDDVQQVYANFDFDESEME
jgi:transcriptional/translational regulatory protein YebC/TACO1